MFCVLILSKNGIQFKNSKYRTLMRTPLNNNVISTCPIELRILLTLIFTLNMTLIFTFNILFPDRLI